MKNKLAFNIGFAVIAFPIALALSKDITFNPLTFKKPALDILYLITFMVLMILIFKKKKKDSGR